MSTPNTRIIVPLVRAPAAAAVVATTVRGACRGKLRRRGCRARRAGCQKAGNPSGGQPWMSPCCSPLQSLLAEGWGSAGPGLWRPGGTGRRRCGCGTWLPLL